MAKYEFIPKGVCSRKIKFELDDDSKISNLEFQGGCPGNLLAISKIVEGLPAEKVIKVFEGNLCGDKKTSCVDQLAHALKLAINTTKNKERL